MSTAFFMLENMTLPSGLTALCCSKPDPLVSLRGGPETCHDESDTGNCQICGWLSSAAEKKILSPRHWSGIPTLFTRPLSQSTACVRIGSPPSMPLTHQSFAPSLRVPTNNRCLPSGVQIGWRAKGKSGWILLGSPPSAGTTNTCPAPNAELTSSDPVSLEKAIHFPSGENFGRQPSLATSLGGLPPSAGTT